MENRKPDLPILLTGGDPAGISPELIEKVSSGITEDTGPVIYFCVSSASHTDKILAVLAKNNLTSALITHEDFQNILSGPEGQKLPAFFTIVDLNPLDTFADWKVGSPGRGSGLLAFTALKAACDYIEKFPVRGLCTAPVSKEWISRGAGIDFPGHTDYLADRFSSKVFMLMHGENFSVIPLTIHIPLKDVSRKLSDAVRDPDFPGMLGLLKNLPVFAQKRWAFCGINPHAGEGGYLGTEEKDYLNDLCESLRRDGFIIDGPLPGDSVFMQENLLRYRLVFSAYHDQGLIPFKALEGRNGINVTLGLPFLRTSPDHGTAYELAGKSSADPLSMQKAFDAIRSGEFNT